MLIILSALAMLSDWICFQLAPIPAITEKAYQGMHPADLVTIFLSANVIFCFVEPYLVVTRGLRRVVVDASVLMFIGVHTSPTRYTFLLPATKPMHDIRRLLAQKRASWVPSYKSYLSCDRHDVRRSGAALFPVHPGPFGCVVVWPK